MLRYPDVCLAALRGGVVVIGNFDGVHAGHRALVALGCEMAAGKPLLALTFEPHPRVVLFPERPLKRLTELPEKAALLAVAGVGAAAVLGFDLEDAGWAPQVCIQRILVDWLAVAGVCVGEDFRFGAKAAGDVAALAADGRFEVRALPLVRDADGVVSSSRLRGEG